MNEGRRDSECTPQKYFRWLIDGVAIPPYNEFLGLVYLEKV